MTLFFCPPAGPSRETGVASVATCAVCMRAACICNWTISRRRVAHESSHDSAGSASRALSLSLPPSADVKGAGCDLWEVM
jgi:hypothetical protein